MKIVLQFYFLSRRYTLFNLFLFLLSLNCFSQNTKTIIIPYGSSGRQIVEILEKEDTASMGKWVAYYDSSINNYGYDYRRKNGYLFHGKYTLINAFGDTSVRGQYDYGLKTGTFIEHNNYNKRLQNISRYDKGHVVESKTYKFNEDHDTLLSVIIASDSLNENKWWMNNAYTRTYDSTGTRLLYEEIPTNTMYKQVKTYYPNGKIHEIFKMDKAATVTSDPRVGSFEEYYPNGTRKTIGQYDFIGNPAGVWINFDKKGRKSATNYIKF